MSAHPPFEPDDEVSLDGLRDIRVYQNINGYRFSVDALLLAAFVNTAYAERIADLGTGSGIIGLLLARQYPDAKVTLIELQQSLFSLAVKNVSLNGLENRVEVLRADIREIPQLMESLCCEIVVSNPPFRKEQSGRHSVGEEKSIARHEIHLNLADLIASASFLLKPRGRFFMIYHPERIFELADCLRQNRLEPKRVRFVHNNTESVSKIVLVEAAKDGRPGLKIDRPLYLYREKGVYTDEVRDMYRT